MTENKSYTLKEYREWLLTQTDPGYEIEAEGNRILFKTDCAEGAVNFHEDLGIAELIIRTKDAEEPMFYLHFEPNDAEHAESLFAEMKETLLHLNGSKSRKILLTCTCGLTTGYFAQMLNEAAEAEKKDYRFDAVPFPNLYEKAFDYDAILLAPQIGYEYKKVSAVLKNKIVLKVPAAAFAQYKAGEVIDMIDDALAERKKAAEAPSVQKDPDINAVFTNGHVILAIAMLDDHDVNRVSYRIYDHGRITLDEEVVKKTISRADIDDLLNYLLKKHDEVETVGIALPGIAYHGSLDMPEYGFEHENLGVELKKKFGKSFVILNDVNAMALGYYAMHSDVKSMVFYFLPRGSSYGGSGIILDGKIHMGYKHQAGNGIGKLADRFAEDAEHKSETPEGCVKLIETALYAYICTIAPEKFVVYSELLPETDDVKEALMQHMPEEYIPEIVRVESLKKFMLPGMMIRCLKALTSEKWLSANQD